MKKIAVLNCIIIRRQYFAAIFLRKDFPIIHMKGSYIMKNSMKTVAKTAALILAATMAGSAIPMNISAVPGGGSSTTSSNSDVELQAALTVAKKRITIPDELEEFDYSTSMSYGTKVFKFRWYNIKDMNSKNVHYIEATVVGDIISSYNEYYGDRDYYGTPGFAKLSESQMLEKAKSYISQLDPSIKDKVTVSLGNNLSIYSNRVTINFARFENGVEVTSNGGNVTIDKNTGELISFTVNWWDNAKFDDASKAKSESEIKELYKKLCKLTPYYKISTNWDTMEKTVEIVYEPDMYSEIDAFTGKKSTIWDDMREAEGTRFYGYNSFYNEVEEAAVADANPATGAGTEGGVEFSKAELEKIQIDNSLITPEKAFEQLKKDKYAALSDDYVISSYDIYSDNNYDAEPVLYEEGKEPKKEEQKFYLSVNFKVKDELKEKYTGYKNISVQLNAKTGEMLYLNRYGKSGELPKLDVTKAKAVADGAATTYSKKIINSYKSDKGNTEPVSTWGDKNQYYETERTFKYNRYENGIQVSGDYIYVDVDSEGTVTRYNFNHTEDVKFPAANILTTDQAFEKLYQQQKFNYYYDGWITKDGQVKTYLLYRMDSFYLNARTGKLCNWYGGEPYSYNKEKTAYSDIKGIPQETAILTLQKHGVTISNEAKFRPNDYIEKDTFASLVSMALGGVYYHSYGEAEYVMVDVPVAADEAYEVPDDASAAEKAAAEKSKYVTRTDAAVMFTQSSGFGKVSELKGIFKTPFSDVKDTDENIGSIAVAYSMGFMKGENGKFSGEKQITRAEAMQMIYDYILSKGNK